MPAVVAAPTEARRRHHHRQEHARCFACGREADGGLGLRFAVGPAGEVSADWICPESARSYEGTMHGGLIATLMDAAMVHALFARDIVARTAELRVRYHLPVHTGEPLKVVARLSAAYGALHCLDAEVWQAGKRCARAQAKFMAEEA